MADNKKQLIEFSSECEMLMGSAYDFVAGNSTIEHVRKLIPTDTGYDAHVWKQMADLGWLGVALPEEYEGAGLDAIALVALVEPMGRALLGSPFIATTLAGQLLLALGDDEQRKEWLTRLATGAVIGTVALLEPEGSWATAEPETVAKKGPEGYELNGIKHQVLDGGNADVILVSALLDGKPAVFLVERSSLPAGALSRHGLMDETRRAHSLKLDGLRVPASALLGGGDAVAALERTGRLGALLIAAEMTGGTHSSMELTLDYLRTRKQFGKLIGGYQALKHPMVEIMTAMDRARSLVFAAATAFADDPDSKGTEIAVRMAKAEAGQTFTHAVDRSVQFHGAIGFTYECHAQLYFRRAQWDEYAYGDVIHHRRALASLVFDE